MSAPALVFCMAGIYRRFRDAGYTVPKFLLPLDGRTILEQVISRLMGDCTPATILLVANRRDLGHAETIRAVAPYETLFIDDTSGQAETAMIGARALVERGVTAPLLFHNVDTIVAGRNLERIGEMLTTADGFIDVFDASSPAYSYVRLAEGSGPRPITEIAEKIVISRHATTGLYGFSSAAGYLHWAERTRRRSAGEFYVSDVYRTMLDGGCRLLANPDDAGQTTVVLGTPAEYEAHIR